MEPYEKNIIPQIEAIYGPKAYQKGCMCQRPPFPDLRKNVVIRATENLFSAMSREDRAASKNQAVITLSGY